MVWMNGGNEEVWPCGGVRWCGRVFGGSEVVWPSVWGE